MGVSKFTPERGRGAAGGFLIQQCSKIPMILHDTCCNFCPWRNIKLRLVLLLGQGLIYKVGVSRTREATFGAERIVRAVSGKYFPRKVAEKHGRVAKY